MSEIVKLRQLQQFSREQLVAMEARVQLTERKQQKMMAFLAKALVNPSFVQNLSQQNEESMVLKGIGIGRKRRLTEGSVTMESEMETLFSATSEPEVEFDPNSMASTSEENVELGLLSENPGNEEDLNWEALLSEDLIPGPGEGEGFEGDQKEENVPVEDLVASPSNWGEDLKDLIDQMGFLTPMP